MSERLQIIFFLTKYINGIFIVVDENPLPSRNRLNEEKISPGRVVAIQKTNETSSASLFQYRRSEDRLHSSQGCGPSKERRCNMRRASIMLFIGVIILVMANPVFALEESPQKATRFLA